MSDHTSSPRSYFMVDVAVDDRRSTAAFLRGEGDGRQRAYDRYFSKVMASGAQMDLPHHRHYSQLTQARTVGRIVNGRFGFAYRYLVPAAGLLLGVVAYVRFFAS